MPLAAYPGKVLVHNMERGAQCTAGGILLSDDNGKSEGVRPRWAQVAYVGDDIKDVQVGNWVLVQHGRWTRGINYEDDILYMVDYPNAVWAVSTDAEMPAMRGSGLRTAKQFEYSASQFTDYAKNQIL